MEGQEEQDHKTIQYVKIQDKVVEVIGPGTGKFQAKVSSLRVSKHTRVYREAYRGHISIRGILHGR